MHSASGGRGRSGVRWAAALAAMLLGVGIWSGSGRAGDEDDGFVPLFDGSSLEGWTPVDSAPDNWKVADGVLVTEGRGAGWLSSDATYSDFVLRAEFRLQAAGNSGLLIRAPRQGEPWITGMEIQILDDDAEVYETLMPYQYCGSVYGVVPAIRGHTREPGQWNTMEIRADGPRITVTLNGATVVDTDLTAHRAAAAGHPGILRPEGYIGLQSHSEPVEFRNIEIKALRQPGEAAESNPGSGIDSP